MQGLFITGTNTDVGKTFIGVNISKQLRQRNVTVIPRKPVESGCKEINGELVPADALALQQAAQYAGDLTDVCPFRFQAAVSPVRAARPGNTTLTTEQLATVCLKDCETGFLLVEGAGGFYSPLAANGLNADLAVALQLPVLLVSDDKLGTLNQVLLTVEAISRRGLKLVGVVLNQRQNTVNTQLDNAADLAEHIHCPIYRVAHSTNNIIRLTDALISSLLAGDTST